MRRALVLLFVFGLFAAPAAAQDLPPPEPPPEPPPVPVVPPGVTVAGLPVEGMTAEEATTAVLAQFRQRLLFRYRGAVWSTAPWRLGASADVAGAVNASLTAAEGTAVPLAVTVDGPVLRAYVQRIRSRYSRQAVNSRVYLRYLRPYVTRARNGHVIRRRETRVLIKTALYAHGRGPLAVPYRTLSPRITRANFGPVVVIRRGSHRLYLYNAMRFRRSFGVAVGQPAYPTPLGRFTIVSKQRNPWWYPPSSSWAAGASPIPPGPLNPLGTRWMGLSRSGVGIHGTPNPASIGYSASHGCIRMRISEAEWLFERVRVGTTVFIVSA